MSALNLKQRQGQEQNINDPAKQSDLIVRLQKDATEEKEELSKILTSNQNAIKVDL